MSEPSADSEKTEEPTPKRIEDALAKGQTPVSREPAVLLALVVLGAWLAFRAGTFVETCRESFRLVWAEAGTLRLAPRDVVVLGGALTLEIALALAPLLLGLVAAGLLAGLAQAEPRFVAERIRPQLSRLSPLKGWARIFGKRGFVEFAKSATKIVAAGLVAVLVLRGAVGELAALLRAPADLLPTVARELVLEVVWAVAVLMVAVAVADIAWTRRDWRQNLRMTRKEVADENKQSEGDPILKARRLSLARDRARRRMIDAVPTATLVIANPTHVAVALRYRHEEDPAPIVVAKGGDHLCLRIRAAAEASGVPVLERVELARALYPVAEIDRPIPESFYRPVAELINFVMDPARAR